jgi:hypothetical protein
MLSSEFIFNALKVYMIRHVNRNNLVQNDYNPCQAQALETGTMDWDTFDRGGATEGDPMSEGLADPMPERIARQVDIDCHRNHLKAPVGAWDSNIYRRSVYGVGLSILLQKR